MLFRQIEYLQAVIEAGNFYDAAEKCHVSQSAVSQQIKKLEDELGVRLLDRHNRTFSLTQAGEVFYQRSLIIRADIEQMIRETKRTDAGSSLALRLGYYKGYHGREFEDAISAISAKYPALRISVMSGSHEDVYRALSGGKIDLALNDQRRAFSGEYRNLVLAESSTFIEISPKSPLCRLGRVEASDLKGIPCILIASGEQQEEERRYYDEIVGLHGEFLFADPLEDARLRILTGQGYLPVDVLGSGDFPGSAVSRVPLFRNGEPVRKTYCAFWKKENSGFYVSEFAEILKAEFKG